MTSKYGYETQSFIADLYDAANEHRSRIDLAFYLDYALKAGGRVLELGCGTGRLLIPAAVAGCCITGLDLSPFMLSKCREKLLAQPLEVQQRASLLEGNMVSFQTRERYTLITLPFRVFHHLIAVDEQKSCLSGVRQHLATGGIIILDLFNCFPPLMFDPAYLNEQEDQRDLKLPGGRSLRTAGRIAAFHRARQYNDTELVYYVSDAAGNTARLVQSFPFRYYFRYEVEHLLELCGFRVIDLFGNFDRPAFGDSSPQMIFIAGKK
jgi:SAM-dependent methyltransferase